jgi:hypothetical protein
MFFWPDMALPLRYGASVKDFTQKVKQELKGTKYVNLMSVNSIILIIRMTQFWFNKSKLERCYFEFKKVTFFQTWMQFYLS